MQTEPIHLVIRIVIGIVLILYALSLLRQRRRGVLKGQSLALSLLVLACFALALVANIFGW